MKNRISFRFCADHLERAVPLQFPDHRLGGVDFEQGFCSLVDKGGDKYRFDVARQHRAEAVSRTSGEEQQRAQGHGPCAQSLVNPVFVHHP